MQLSVEPDLAASGKCRRCGRVVYHVHLDDPEDLEAVEEFLEDYRLEHEEGCRAEDNDE